jgi:hypothetical protein
MKFFRFSLLLCMYFAVAMTRSYAQSGIYDYSGLKPIIVAAHNASSADKSKAKYVCDGSSDEDEINRALREGKLVQLTGGEFKIDGTITGGNNILVGAGKTRTIIRMAGGLGTGISIGGSQSKISGIGGNISKGATTLRASSDMSSKLRAGDKIMIGSKDVFSGDRGYYIKGEIAEVRSVSGSTITVTKPLQDSYTTSKETRIVKYNFRKDVGVADLTVISGGNRSRMVDLHEVDRGFFKNVKVEDPKRMAMQGMILSHAVNSVIDGCEAVGIQDNWKNQSGAQGYGYYFFGVEDTELRNSTGYNNKHSIELGGFWWVPVTRRITIKNVTATSDIYSPFSTHGASEDITWIDCTAKNCGGGFIIRNPKTKIIRPKVYGATLEPFHIGEFTQQGGNWPKWYGRSAEDIYIYDAVVEVAKGHPFLDVYDPVKNIRIDGGTWKGARNQAFLFRGNDCDNLVIENANIDLTGQNSGQYVVEINPQSGSPTISATFRNSKLCNPAVKSSFIKKTVGGSANVSNVTIDCALDMVAGDLDGNFDNVGSGPTPIEARKEWRLDAGLEYGTKKYGETVFEPMLPYMSGRVSNMPRTLAIEGTEYDELYATEVYNSSAETVISLPVDTGVYDVHLHFAEVYFTEAGKRSFHVDVEGQRVITDLDIVSEVGANTALLKSFTDVNVADGKLEVKLTNSVQNAKIAGIEVLPKGQSPLAVGSVNQAPKFAGVEDVIISGGASQTIELVATDAEGEAVTLEAIELPEFAQFTDAGNGKASVTLAPAKGQEGTYTIKVAAKDASGNQNILTIGVEVASLSVWRLDAGLVGGVKTYENNEFQPLKPYVSGSAYDLPRQVEIANTENDELYASELYSTSATTTISLPVTTGTYDVHLHFAEVYFTEAGKRTFHVDVEGNRMLNSFDIASEVGGNAALIKSFEKVEVKDGKLEVVLTKELQNVKISGIEVLPHGEKPLTISTPSPSVWRLDAGLIGGVKTYEGKEFQPMMPYMSGSAYNLPRQLEIAKTENDELYASEIYATSSTATLTLPVTNGTYDVHMHLAEVYFTEGGKRKFHVDIEGQRMVNSLDIASEVGGNTAMIKSFESVEVTDGKLEVVLTKELQNAKLAGIEVLPHGEAHLTLSDSDTGSGTDYGSLVDLGFAISPVYQVNVDEKLTLTLGSTLNGADVQWEVINQPSFASLVMGEEFVTLTFAPVYGDEGQYKLQVKATDANGQEAYMTYVINVNGNSIASRTIETEALVKSTFPNPIQNQVTFELSKPLTGTFNLQFFDMNGGVLYNMEQSLNNEYQFTVDLSSVSYQGVLIAKIYNNETGEETVKLYKAL